MSRWEAVATFTLACVAAAAVAFVVWFERDFRSDLGDKS